MNDHSDPHAAPIHPGEAEYYAPPPEPHEVAPEPHASAHVAPPAPAVPPAPAARRSLSLPPRIWLPVLGALQLATLGTVVWVWTDVPPPAPPAADLTPVRADVADAAEKVAKQVKQLRDEHGRREQLTTPQVEKLAAAATNAGMIDESLKKWDARLVSLETSGKDWAKEASDLRAASGELKKVPDAIKLKIEASLDGKIFQALIAEASQAAAAKVAADGKKALDEQQKAFVEQVKALARQQEATLLAVAASQKAMGEATGNQIKALQTVDLTEIARRLVAAEKSTQLLTERIADLANKDAKVKRQDVAVVLFHSRQLDAAPFVAPVKDAVLNVWGKVPGVRYGVVSAHSGAERVVLLPFDAAAFPAKLADLGGPELEAAEKADGLDPNRLFLTLPKAPAPPMGAAPPLKRVVLVVSDSGGPPPAEKDAVWKDFVVDAVVAGTNGKPLDAANFLAWARFCHARGGVAVPETTKDKEKLRATFDRLVAPR